MPTFIGTPREFKILIDALSAPMGVTKVDRGLAEELRRRLQLMMSSGNHAPLKTAYATGHIRTSWPTGIVKPDKKPNNWFKKPTKEKGFVQDATGKAIRELLDGLI